MKTIVITSGYYNPIHPGHIECLKLCKDLGDELWVIVNNDQQAQLKTWKTELFQDQDFRMAVVGAIRHVDEVFLSVDSDSSVCKSIETLTEKIRKRYWEDTQIIFWKGGDRFAGNIPELEVCKVCNIEIRDWLGSKTHNSSDLRRK